MRVTFSLSLALLAGHAASHGPAFVPAASSRSHRVGGISAPKSSPTSLNFFQDMLKSLTPEKAPAVSDYDEPIAASLDILYSAAETKSEDPEAVVTALEDLEQLMRKKCKAEPDAAEEVLRNLDGSWRLVFTTGTKETQDKIKKTVNYFPVKAVQSFDTTTDPYGIENGIYLGDFAVVKFSGPFDFDSVKRKLEFDFTKINILGLSINIKSDDAAKVREVVTYFQCFFFWAW